MIPHTFEAWNSCIINDCKIDLTLEFAQKRLSVYTDKNNAETKKFAALYGEQHLYNVITWLNMVLNQGQR